MGAAIIAFLTSLPALLTLVNKVGAWLLKVSGNDPAGFVVKLGAAFDELSKADTPEKKGNAAKSLADLISGL